MQSGSRGGVFPAPPLQTTALTPRLLYVATSKNDGGIERYSVRMAAELRKRGFPILYACQSEGIIDIGCRAVSVPTHPFALRNSGDLRAASRLADLILGERIDLVHVHSRRDYVPAMVGVALARRRRRQKARSPRLVLHAHMLRALGEPPRLSGRLFAWGADTVLAVSTAVRERVLEAHGFPPSFVRLLHNGVDVEAFTPRGTPEATARRQAIRHQWEIPAEGLVIGMVGRLDAKGQASLLSAVPSLIAQFPTLRVVLVGAEGNSGTRERLLEMAETGGFADRLTLMGPREDIPNVLPAFDVLAHLPTDESFGLAPAEAMAAGLPTVVTNIGGCREVVREGVTGFLVQPNDIPELTGALSRLLSQPDLRRRFGEAGRAVTVAEFSLARQIDRLQALYEELCPVPLSSHP